ncbi:unnamed protein product [Leuciscus chuanchicus]
MKEPWHARLALSHEGAPAGSLRSLTPPSVACERWMARLSPGPTSRCGTAGEDRGGGTAEMRMGGERGRSYKLRRNSGYLTPACLSSTINHAQELSSLLLYISHLPPSSFRSSCRYSVRSVGRGMGVGRPDGASLIYDLSLVVYLVE